MRDTTKPHFANLRLASEFPIYKQLIWKLFGTKSISSTVDPKFGYCVVTAYNFKNVTYVHEVLVENWED